MSDLLDYTQITATDDGTEHINEVKQQFQNAEADLDARPKFASDHTISGDWIFSGKFTLSSAAAPSSASDTGTQWEIRIDANYIYICVATNTWKRVAISTWT